MNGQKASNLKIRKVDKFVNGLKKDMQAARDAIIYEYNNGLVEGSVNKLKVIIYIEVTSPIDSFFSRRIKKIQHLLKRIVQNVIKTKEDDNMNIGFVSTWFERGAAYVTKTYINFLKEKHNIYVYARGGEAYAKNDPNWDLPYVTWGKRVGMGIEISLSDISKWIEKNSLDIIFFNEQQDFTPVYKIKKKYPYLILGSYIDYYKLDTIENFKVFDFLICNTKRHYEVFSWHPQCFYVPWGTDIILFNSSKKIKNEKITFFHSQGMSNRKGTETLINTFVESNLYQSSKLLIHTQNNLNSITGIKYKNLERFNIQIINKTVTAPGLYHLGDVYVYPTKLEGIGLTIMEALASGLPVITTNSPPMNEFVNDTNGKLIKVKKLIARPDGYYWPLSIVDETDLAEKMKYYIENKKNLDYFSKKARESAENNLNVYKNFSKLNDIFEQVKLLNILTKQEIENKIKTNENKELKKAAYYIFKKIAPDFLKDMVIGYYKTHKNKI